MVAGDLVKLCLIMRGIDKEDNHNISPHPRLERSETRGTGIKVSGASFLLHIEVGASKWCLRGIWIGELICREWGDVDHM